MPLISFINSEQKEEYLYNPIGVLFFMIVYNTYVVSGALLNVYV